MSSNPFRKYGLFWAQMRTVALVELGCIDLDPTKQGRVADCHAAVGQHAFPVTVVDQELRPLNGSFLLRIVCQTFSPGLPSVPAHR